MKLTPELLARSSSFINTLKDREVSDAMLSTRFTLHPTTH